MFWCACRSTRESTPCSMRDSDSMGTPGSTTRRTTSTETNRRARNGMRRNIPTAHEMEEFFVYAEKQQQRIFIEKYATIFSALCLKACLELC
jgi:hypothetical protein